MTLNRNLQASVWSTGAWRGRWIWDPAVLPVDKGGRGQPANWHSVYLRRKFTVSDRPGRLLARVLCDWKYELFLNGELLGRGPVRSIPDFQYWDEYDLASRLQPGRNVLVALCLFQSWHERHLYGATLGQGSFCLETEPGSDVDFRTDDSWSAVTTPWLSVRPRQEIVDGRRLPAGLHDPDFGDDGWPAAAILTARSWEQAGPYPDRPPSHPYVVLNPRPIPPLTARIVDLTRVDAKRVVRDERESVPETWATMKASADGDEQAGIWDIGRLTFGHIHLRVKARPEHGGASLDLVSAEWLRDDGMPAFKPLQWTSRYTLRGEQDEAVSFLRPASARYIATVGPSDLDIDLEMEETIYPRPEGASFECDDERYTTMWSIGVRTVDCCANDAFVDGSREDQAWLGDAGVEIPVHAVTSPDLRLVRRSLELGAQSRYPSGLLSATAPEEGLNGTSIPDFSLHWLRNLVRYWEYSGDEVFVRAHMPVAEGIIERYESYRGSSGLLEDVPGWVFIDWAQIHRDSVIGAHDALYAATLADYGTLPGAAPVGDQLAATATAFEALWESERQIYVDAIGPSGRSQRVSQHTNGAALLAGLVPAERVGVVAERLMDPTPLGGRLVPAGFISDDIEWQLQMPDDFDPAVDVLAAQPFFAFQVHAGLSRAGRRDLILKSLTRWSDPKWMWTNNGTFPEFADWTPDAPGAAAGDACHGFSACPTYDLTTYFLGLSPTEPGYGRARLHPFLGPLQWVSGTVPTPHGWIKARIDRESVDLAVPPGVEILLHDETIGAGDHHMEVALPGL